MSAWVSLMPPGADCPCCEGDDQGRGYWICPECGAEWFPQADYSEADLEEAIAAKPFENLP